MQRMQLAVYPDIAGEFVNVDRWPDSDARRAAHELIVTLDSLDAMALGAERDEHDPDGIPFLRFDGEAQQAFDAWRIKLEQRLRSNTDHPVIVEHLAKYRSLIPSLALLIHLAEGHSGRVGRAALERAIGWGEYLESHARRIYSVAIAPDTVEAIALARKIQAGDLLDGFGLRDVYRNHWIGLCTSDAAERAAKMLCDLDWLAENVESTPGRPRTTYRINPKVLKTPHSRSAKSDKSSSDPSSGTFGTAQPEGFDPRTASDSDWDEVT